MPAIVSAPRRVLIVLQRSLTNVGRSRPFAMDHAASLTCLRRACGHSSQFVERSRALGLSIIGAHDHASSAKRLFRWAWRATTRRSGITRVPGSGIGNRYGSPASTVRMLIN